MENKGEEDISWLFLWGATILYTVVICMAFAGLVVTKPTVGAAFLDFTKDYGALLAGIPVLIAVLVAKEQLDANRRQHSIQLFESKRNELDALQGIISYCRQVDSEISDALHHGLDITLTDLNLTYRAGMFLPFSINQAFSRLNEIIATYNHTNRMAVRMYGINEDEITEHSKCCKLISDIASVLINAAFNRTQDIQKLAPSTQISPDFIL